MVDLSMCGVLYVATGERYVDAANESAKSLKAKNPELTTHLFGDAGPAGKSFFDSFEKIETPHRRSKVDYVGKTPFEYTLFLDADTRVVGNVSAVFGLLARYDIAAAHAHNRVSTNRLFWKAEVPYAFPQLNTGVLAFRKTDEVMALLERWRQSASMRAT